MNPLLATSEIQAFLNTFPSKNRRRGQHLFDNGEYQKIAVQDVPQDPLKFRDGKRYTDRIKTSKSETGLDDAVLVAEGLLEGQEVVAAAQDFRFMAGSLGMAAGEVGTGRHGGQDNLPQALVAPPPVKGRRGLSEAVDRPMIVALGLVG